MNKDYMEKNKPYPRDSANIFSTLSFYYTLELFLKGFRQNIDIDDLYQVVGTCESKKLGDELEEQWNIAAKREETPSLIRIFWKCHWKTFTIIGVLQLFMSILTTIVQPYALSKLISFFNPAQTDITQNQAMLYAFYVIGLYVVNIFFKNNVDLGFIELGVKVRVAICSLIYRQVLTLHSDAVSRLKMGKIATIITKDIDAIEMFIEYANYMWVCAIQIIVICVLIYQKIGLTSLFGAVFFFCVLPLQVFVAILSYRYRLENSSKTDDRIDVVQEILSSIKQIKMYTWEKIFQKKVEETRKEELKILHKFFYTKVAILILSGVASQAAFFIFIVSYMYINGMVTAEIVYYIVAIFGTLEGALSTTIPIGFAYFCEVAAVLKRIKDVLFATKSQPALHVQGPPEIYLKNVDAAVHGTIILQNITLDITERGLYAVVGSVGSGKSTFLKLLLHECQFSGEVNLSGKISYAAQDPWLFPSTIRNNILFGEKFQETRYRKVLKVCSLEYDLEMLEDGDNTVVGDRGSNLSRGQQVRVNLARAVYRDADIYLLDDCLASLDGDVSDSIFNSCIKQFLKNKFCILTTNSVAHMSQCDKLISIKDGFMRLEHNRSVQINIKTRMETNYDVKLKEERVKKPIYAEEKAPGAVSWNVYYQYFKFGNGALSLCVLVILFVVSQSFVSLSDKILSEWVTLEQNFSNLYVKNETNTPEFEESHRNKTNFFKLWIGFAATAIILSVLRSIAFFRYMKAISVNMHHRMLSSVLYSKMSFFDQHFLGNILNRFSKDFLCLDEFFPFTVGDCAMMFSAALGGIMLLTTIKGIYLAECLGLIVAAAALKVFFQPTTRNLHRLSSIARSPIIGHLNSTLEGLTTIRAYQAQRLVSDEFDKHQNRFTSANFCAITSSIGMSVAIELICGIFVAVVILQFLYLDFETQIGDIGLGISQAFVITSIITYGVKSLTGVENQMTSVERILEYINNEQEDTKITTINNWPKNGSLEFKNVSLNYGTCANTALEGLNFVVRPKESLGIIGRTGAGKSSIISSLLRLYETSGRITIGDRDIKTVSLRQLRRNISVIPQDPFLFSGTLRLNLDPFQEHSDSKIWEVIKKLNLSFVDNLHKVIDKTSNFSEGQKQLLCLARAFLRNNEIIVLDEVSANVDRETDILITEAIQKCFADCTVLVVAHKLLSIINCGKIIVLNKGKVAEYGETKNLIKDESSFLTHVIK